MMALVLAVMTIMAFSVPSMVFAADGETPAEGGETPAATLADGSIKITPPAGLAANASNEYKIYKVFDATNNGTAISYKIDSKNGDLSQAMKTAGFSVDSAGNVSGPQTLDAAAISAIAAYATDLVKTVTATGSNPVTADGLGAGYYYITTSTGTVVTIDSTNPSAEVNDKNTVPSLDKTITNTDKTSAGMAGTIDADGKKALAELGKDVEYTATITVGKGAKGYEFHDNMGSGLTFKGNENVTVTADPAVTGITGSWYTIKDTPDSGDTLTITFADGIAENTVITIKYVGTVNSDALTVDTGKNTARVDYGDENSTNHTPDSTTNIYNARFTVTKKDGNSAALGGAGFVIKNANNKYYKKAGTVVSWVDSIDQASEYTSDASTGVVPSFTGLVNGTYTLIEKTVPAGYNKAADSTFTIAASDYTDTNLVQAADVINQQGSELPSTGGIGTKIFYALGALLVVGCGIVLVARRRMSKEQ